MKRERGGWKKEEGKREGERSFGNTIKPQHIFMEKMYEYKVLKRRYHSVNGFSQCINNEYYLSST